MAADEGCARKFDVGAYVEKVNKIARNYSG